MKRVLAVAALAAATAFGTPANADDVTVCLGHATVSVAGQPVVDEELGCHVVDLP